VISVLITATVVALGAWTRLKDAGLGCPDWPTCYGSLSVPLSDEAIARAHLLYPDQPLVAEKAWPEMIHRHFAKAIGLLCILMSVFALLAVRHGEKDVPVKHAVFLLLLVCLQGAFGAWTVTMKLFPPVVTGHLLFGFATFTTLFLLVLRLSPFLRRSGATSQGLLPLTIIVTVVLVLQIALGGWTASNYAATQCTALPICEGDWISHLDFANAFALYSYNGQSYEFAPHLQWPAMLTIHVSHRIGAWVTMVLISFLILLLWVRGGNTRYRKFAGILGLVLVVQVVLGISNVIFHLPLAVAVAHNFVALMLLQVMAALTFSLVQERKSS
jgi:cytochrome c oxidase assembly protein subunit 15